MYSLKEFEQKLKEVENWFEKEMTGIRTGRANSSLLDSMLVDAYGARTPINQLGSISSEDARTLRISAWDAGVIKSIEKAIALADLGISTVADDKGLRVIFPELTSERREILVKQVGRKLEEARISIRNDRTKVLNEIQDGVKAGTTSEDGQFRLKKDIQTMIDKSQADLEKKAEQKETEIKS